MVLHVALGSAHGRVDTSREIEQSEGWFRRGPDLVFPFRSKGACSDIRLDKLRSSTSIGPTKSVYRVSGADDGLRDIANPYASRRRSTLTSRVSVTVQGEIQMKLVNRLPK